MQTRLMATVLIVMGACGGPGGSEDPERIGGGDVAPPASPDARALVDAMRTSSDAAAFPDTSGGDQPVRDGAVALDAVDRPEAGRFVGDAGTSDTTAPDPATPMGARTAGCMGGAGLPEGKATIVVGAMTRAYILRLPAGYTSSRAWPLVLALHPNANPVSYWDGTTGDRAIRTAFGDKAIIVLPQGRGNVWNDNLPLDLAYFDALLSQLKSALCIDNRRIFSMGFSGGGSFSGVLGCSRKDIRAIAAGGAVTYFDPKDCVGKPAAWVTIGAKETTSGREAFRDFWRSRNGCKAMTTAVAPAGCMAYGCPDGSPVHFCPHAGGHVWPGFGTAAVWSFFSALGD